MSSDLEDGDFLYLGGDFHVMYYDLTSLKGCPEEITGHFCCSHNYLTSFKHFPRIIRGCCTISHNLFTSFKDIDQHIKFIDGKLCALHLDITSGFSDLFGIDGLQRIEIELENNYKIQDIVNKHIKKKDLINFQDEMIKSGYESYL